MLLFILLVSIFVTCERKRFETLFSKEVKFGTCPMMVKETLDWKDLTIRYNIGKYELGPDTCCDHLKGETKKFPGGCEVKPKDRSENFNDLLDLMKFWNDYAEGEKIIWSGTAGVVIGYCHDQPLPWDDDVDIIIRKQDVAKLLKLYASGTPMGHDNRKIQYRGHTVIMKGRVGIKSISGNRNFWPQFFKYPWSKTRPCGGFLEIGGCVEEAHDQNGVRFCKHTGGLVANVRQYWGPFDDSTALDYPRVDFCGMNLRIPKSIHNAQRGEARTTECLRFLKPHYGLDQGESFVKTRQLYDPRHPDIKYRHQYHKLWREYIFSSEAVSKWYWQHDEVHRPLLVFQNRMSMFSSADVRNRLRKGLVGLEYLQLERLVDERERKKVEKDGYIDVVWGKGSLLEQKRKEEEAKKKLEQEKKRKEKEEEEKKRKEQRERKRKKELKRVLRRRRRRRRRRRKKKGKRKRRRRRR